MEGIRVISKNGLKKIFEISMSTISKLINENKEEFNKYKFNNSSINYIYNEEFLRLWINIFRNKIKKSDKTRSIMKYEGIITKLVILLKNYNSVKTYDFIVA